MTLAQSTSDALQYAFNGISSGSAYALIGIGFMLVYSTCRFFHFAHGIVFTIGAYATYASLRLAGSPPSAAIVCGICTAVLVGSIIEIGVYRPLRHANSSSLVLLLASLSIYTILQTLVAVLFGTQTVTLRGANATDSFSLLGARITSIQMIIIFTALIISLIMWASISLTSLGRMVRATANDPELAVIKGIQTERVFLIALAVGSMLAGVAGVLVAYDTDLTPTMGLNALLMGMVASIVGGNRSIPGVWLGGLLLGLSHQFAGLILPTQWQTAIVFGILLIVLLVRPQGIMGTPLRKVTA